MNVDIVTEAAQFLFWEYIKSKFLCSVELELLSNFALWFGMLNNNKWHVPEVNCKNAQECRDAGFDGLPPGVMDFRQAVQAFYINQKYDFSRNSRTRYSISSGTKQLQ